MTLETENGLTAAHATGGVQSKGNPPEKPTLNFEDVDSLGHFIDYLKNNTCKAIADHPRVFKFIVAAATTAIAAVVALPSAGVASLGAGALGAIIEKIVSEASNKVVTRIDEEQKKYVEYNKDNADGSKQNQQQNSREKSASFENDSSLTKAEMEDIKFHTIKILEERAKGAGPSSAQGKTDFDIAKMAQQDLSMQDLNSLDKSFSIVEAFHKLAQNIGNIIFGKESPPASHQAVPTDSKPETVINNPKGEGVLQANPRSDVGKQ